MNVFRATRGREKGENLEERSEEKRDGTSHVT